MAYSLEEARKWADNPRSIPPGTYGEGVIKTAYEQLQGLKADVKAGKLTVRDFLDISEPLSTYAAKVGRDLASGSSAGVTIAKNAGWYDLKDQGFFKFDGDQILARVPFSTREYAQLPENVLPTQSDVNSGIIPRDYLPPIERFRPETPTTQPGGDGLTQPGTQQIPDPNNPGQFITVPIVGDPLSSGVPKTADQAIIEAEARRQAEQSRQAYEAEKAIRSQRLTDLSSILTQEENRKFNLAQPGVYEDLNTRGLLRSSGLGQALAKEKSKLAGESANVLLQQGLQDRDYEIQGIQDILGRTQQFQTSGLERKFTLEDFKREAELAKTLGSSYTPQVKGGNTVLSGALSGAVAGGGAGAALGPWGAGIGAILGGLGGAAGGKGK